MHPHDPLSDFWTPAFFSPLFSSSCLGSYFWSTNAFWLLLQDLRHPLSFLSKLLSSPYLKPFLCSQSLFTVKPRCPVNQGFFCEATSPFYRALEVVFSTRSLTCSNIISYIIVTNTPCLCAFAIFAVIRGTILFDETSVAKFQFKSWREMFWYEVFVSHLLNPAFIIQFSILWYFILD